MSDATQQAQEGADAFTQLDAKARAAGQSIAAALSAGQVEGRKLDDVLRGVGLRLSDMALQTAGRTLGGLFSSALSQGLSSVLTAGAEGAAAGGASLFSSLGSAVSSSFGGENAQGTGRALNVVMNVSTPDADSFRQSEAQVSAALARAVQRGDRGQ
jgi:hypothetical protein